MYSNLVKEHLNTCENMVTRSQLGDFPSTAHSTMRCQETAAVVQQLVQPGPFFLQREYQ